MSDVTELAFLITALNAALIAAVLWSNHIQRWFRHRGEDSIGAGSYQGRNRPRRAAAFQRRRQHEFRRERSEFYLRTLFVASLFAIAVSIAMVGLDIWRHAYWPVGGGDGPVGAEPQTVVIESLKLDLRDVPGLVDSGIHAEALSGPIARMLLAAALGAFLILVAMLLFWRSDVAKADFWRRHQLETNGAFMIIAALLGAALSGLFSPFTGGAPPGSRTATDPVLITLPAPPYPDFVVPAPDSVISTIFFVTEESTAPGSLDAITALSQALSRCAGPDARVVVNVEGISSSSEFRERGRISEESKIQNLKLANARGAWVRDRIREANGGKALDVGVIDAESYDEVAMRRLLVDRPGEAEQVSGIEQLNQAAQIILVDAGRCRRK